MGQNEEEKSQPNEPSPKYPPTAGGSFGGFFFQGYYALYELCKCENENEIVSIEKMDDVGISRCSEEELVQLKCTTSSNNPASDLSLDFWKAIYNWANAGLVEGRCYRYVVLSLRKISQGDLVCKINDAETDDACEASYNEMIRVLSSSTNSEETFVKHRDFLMNVSNKEIVIRVIRNLRLDIHSESFVNDLSVAVRHKCLESPHYARIKCYMLGWLDEKIASAIESKTNLEVSYSDFAKVLRGELEKYRDGSLVPAAFPSEETVLANLRDNPMYLRQLDLIQADDDDKRDAVRNFIIEQDSFSHWIDDEDITKDEYTDYCNSIVESFRDIRRDVKCDCLPEVSEGKKIYSLLNLEVSKNIKIDDVPVHVSVARGTVHALSNQMTIGWHPRYKELLKKKEDEDD